MGPVLRGQGREGGRPRSAPEVAAVVGTGAGCELPGCLGRVIPPPGHVILLPRATGHAQQCGQLGDSRLKREKIQ